MLLNMHLGRRKRSSSLIPPSIPSSIVNFVATGNEQGQVTVTFTNATGKPTPTYNLYEDTLLVASGINSGYAHSVAQGTHSYYIIAVNSEGSVQSNTDSGTSLEVLVAPSVISDFSATDNQAGQVTLSFTAASGNPTPTYNLYEDAVLVATNIPNNYVHSVAEGTYSYYIIAVNSEGSIQSNTDSGTSGVQAVSAYENISVIQEDTGTSTPVFV